MSMLRSSVSCGACNRKASEVLRRFAGWLAGGLAEAERAQLVSKLAPAGSSWLIQFVLDRLPTSADREQVLLRVVATLHEMGVGTCSPKA